MTPKLEHLVDLIFSKLKTYKRKKRKRKNAFKRFKAKLKKNAFRSYGTINITEAS